MKINSIMAKNMINAYSKQKQYVKADIGNKQLKDKVEISEDAKYLSKINNDNENINLDKVNEINTKIGVLPAKETGSDTPKEASIGFTSKHGKNFIGGSVTGKFELTFKFE